MASSLARSEKPALVSAAGSGAGSGVGLVEVGLVSGGIAGMGTQEVRRRVRVMRREVQCGFIGIASKVFLLE